MPYAAWYSDLTCAWYSTECAFVSSHRCPSSVRTKNPDDVDVNCRFLCQGKEKFGFECTHRTLTTAFINVSCTSTACCHFQSAYNPKHAALHQHSQVDINMTKADTLRSGEYMLCTAADLALLASAKQIIHLWQSQQQLAVRANHCFLVQHGGGPCEGIVVIVGGTYPSVSVALIFIKEVLKGEII